MKRKPLDIRDYEGWKEADFAEDLRTNPRYQDYFKDYSPKSVESFISSYAFSKYMLHTYKTRLITEAEDQRTRFLVAADEFLDVILQKKLFNLQCLWRADMIELPFIEYTDDFKYFEEDIRSCPFIEPITEKEIEIAVRFLNEVESQTDEYFTDWQDYEGFKVWDALDDEEEGTVKEEPLYSTSETEIPEFYIFYDNYMQTSHLFNLPDRRIDQDNYHLEIIRAENRRLAAIKYANTPPQEPELPWLSVSNTDKFVKEQEDRKTQELFELSEKEKAFGVDDDDMAYVAFLLSLRREGEIFPFVEDKYWYSALTRTVALHKRKKTAEMLPFAYATYMLEFEEADWETIKAQRIARFKFDEEKNGYWYREHQRENIALVNELLKQKDK